MPERPAAEKTEQPTPKRLEKAREQGQVPQSQELAPAVSLVVLTAAVALMAPGLLQWFCAQLREGLAGHSAVFAGGDVFIGFVRDKLLAMMGLIWPVLLALVAASILAGLAVSGVNFTPAAVRLRFEMVNPVAGFGRLFNARSGVRLLASILKLLLIGLIIWLYIRGRLTSLAALRWVEPVRMAATIGHIILGLMIRIGLVLLVLAAAEVLYQKWKHLQDLRMTRQEVKQERKDYEGAPEVKRRIRRVQLEMAMRRIAVEVPKASVVLVNPTHVAVALRYDADTMEAPVLVAKGADHLAERIRQIARAYGVPVVRRPELARTIYSTVRLGRTIPASLYVAVAEVLAMIYRLREKKRAAQEVQ